MVWHDLDSQLTAPDCRASQIDFIRHSLGANLEFLLCVQLDPLYCVINIAHGSDQPIRDLD